VPTHWTVVSKRTIPLKRTLSVAKVSATGRTSTVTGNSRPNADNSAYVAWEVTRTPPLMASSPGQDQGGKRLLPGWQVIEAAGALRVGTGGDPL
jgi:hypothetical protein